MRNMHFKVLKTFLNVLILLLGSHIAAQVPHLPDMPDGLPKVLPPSPSVAALMKFEEVPVDNYTGIPDISIPLYSIGTHSKDIALNLSLKYHPSSIAIDEDASYTGLGWSLFGGGTISRTVRGLPDEWNIGTGTGKLGIYNPNNPYYEALSLIGNLNMDEQERETFNKLLWETAERGTYDTEHDLYQYNFMGHSGRFYIKKTASGYEVVKLDNDNVLQITYNASAKTFTIKDDKNNSYFFNIKEETIQNNGSTLFEYFGPGGSGTSFQEGVNYTSAFHLSTIHDANNKLLITYQYNNPETEPMKESTRDVSSTYTILRNPDVIGIIQNSGASDSEFRKLDPKSTITVFLRVTDTRKIKRIIVADKAMIDFKYVTGRTDDGNTGSYRLNGIDIKNPAGTFTGKKFAFEYQNSTINLAGANRSRMLLKKVTESDGAGNLSQAYELEYEEPDVNVDYTKDYWGYLRHTTDQMPPFLHRSTNPVDCKIDVLQKMKLPSGGATIFNFESNRYSCNGSEALTDFDENMHNWSYYKQTFNFYSNGGASAPQGFSFLSNGPSYVSFSTTSSVADGQPGSFRLYKMVNGVAQDLGGINCNNNNGDCQTQELELQSGQYQIRFHWFNVNISGTGKVIAYVRYRNLNNYQFLYGGGVRIKNIGYFEDGKVPRRYYDSSEYQDGYKPAKQKDYDYRFYDNPLRSSGSLVFPRPTFSYSENNEVEILRTTGGGLPIYTLYDVQYTKSTTINRLNPIKTKGSDVGYKNVAVSEIGNGKSHFTYTSAIDHPENYQNSASPFGVSPNYDYKRGLLTKEEHYTQDSRLLNEAIYKYEIAEDSMVTGLKVNVILSCPYMWFYHSFLFYYGTIKNCRESNNQGSLCLLRECDWPSEYIGYPEVQEAFGWVKLIEKETKENFYTSSNTLQGTVITKDKFGYNPHNKKIEWKETETYGATGSIETMRNDYTYYMWPLNNNLSSINTIETRKNGNLVSKQKMIYSNQFPGNISYLPSIVQSAKGGQDLENRVEFYKYDIYGNPLEVKLTEGAPVSYIWGYNKTQPIAMIENATYEELAAALGTDVNDLQNSYTEANLGAINALRTSMPNVMVTTYTYEPLKGVTSITDPKGYITTYHYDEMLRLKEVRDTDNNLLSENKYHYRP